jgi:hypothetical protein
MVQGIKYATSCLVGNAGGKYNYYMVSCDQVFQKSSHRVQVYRRHQIGRSLIVLVKCFVSREINVGLCCGRRVEAIFQKEGVECPGYSPECSRKIRESLLV